MKQVTKDTASDEEVKKKRRDHEFQYGGYRSDENKDRYWLTGKEIVEFERNNAETVDDAKFWKWFAHFRKEHRIIKSSWYTGERGAVSWSGGSTTKGEYLSDWWTDGYFSKKGYSGYSASTTKLALALSAIRTVIRVIDDSDPPMSVHWARKHISYTDFTNNEIHISPKPIQDSAIPDGEAIDVSTAFAMHEASHATYTKPIWDRILRPTPVNPVTISSLMANLLEDIRIERNTAEKFPGFREYFEKGLDYLWKEGEGKGPKQYGPDLQSKLNFAIAAVKWPAKAEALYRTVDSEELDWWQHWSDAYQADDKLPIRDSCEAAIAHLRLATEEEKKKGESDKKGEGKAAKEMDEIAEEEEKRRLLGEKLRSIAEKLRKSLLKGTLEFCSHPDPEDSSDGLDETEESQVERLVTEELRKEDVLVKMPNGNSFAEVFVTRPAEDESSKGAYIGKPNPHLARLKAALVFRQELPQYTNRLQREGDLDEEELWRWSSGDYRLFEEKIIAVHPKVQMSLLVDMSGSMYGQPLRTAQELAQLFVWALKDMTNVTTKVFGHTANLTGVRDCQVYRLWEPGDPLTRLGLISTLPHINNYDGFAIASVAKELMERGEDDEQRVLIVLADGYPAGSGYGGSAAYEHVRSVDSWARRNGVEVIQIAIDQGLDASRQSAMFKQWVPYTDTASLPRKLEALLAKLT